MESILRPICLRLSVASRQFLTATSPRLLVHTERTHLRCKLFGWSFVRGMAGHSKWQNIRHVKAATDAARAKTFSKLARLMKVAIRDGKSNDPKYNIQLSHVVDMAKRANMPYTKLESILKEKEVSKELLVPFTLEAKGPGGCFLILEGLTDNLKRTRQMVRSYMNKVGVGSLVESGAKHMFDHKGIVVVDPVKNGLCLEKAVEIAIEVGAEDVIEVEEDDGTKVLQFLCEPREFYIVKKEMNEKGIELLTSGLEYIAHTKVELSDEHLNLLDKLNDYFDEDQDVMKCYDNIN